MRNLKLTHYRSFRPSSRRRKLAGAYLAKCRWSDGFVCPRCGHRQAYELGSLRLWQCTGWPAPNVGDGRDILHRTKAPLTVWFWAASLMTTDKRGLSALLLQRQLGLGNYETAWMMLHKFRRPMVNASGEPLHGEVEIDDTWIGGTQAGLRGSRQLKGRKTALVWWRWRSATNRRGAFAWRSFRTSRRHPAFFPEEARGAGGHCLHPRTEKLRRTSGSRLSSICPASSPLAPLCEKVPSRSCLWRIARSATCNSG